jgi:phosphoribosylformimino-5-aminoimidazole carboxamide ribonucleotide (ProFAR) isomerase
LISRITGSIYLLLSSSEKVKKSRKEKEVKPGVKKKVNVGLKFKKTKEEISGWSKRVDDEWFFSSDTIEILQRYIT